MDETSIGNSGRNALQHKERKHPLRYQSNSKFKDDNLPVEIFNAIPDLTDVLLKSICVNEMQHLQCPLIKLIPKAFQCTIRLLFVFR